MWAVIISLAFYALGALRTNRDPMLTDGLQNLLMSYNLYHHNSFSLGATSPIETFDAGDVSARDWNKLVHMAKGVPFSPSVYRDWSNLIRLGTSAPFSPSMYREPLPIMVTAFFELPLVDLVVGTAPPEKYFHGDRARFMRILNALWLLPLLLSVFAATRFLSGSTFFAILTMILIGSFCVAASGMMLNKFQTDMAGAALVACSSLAFAAVVQNPTLRAALLAGISFGLLILTKAAFLYVGVGAIVLFVGVEVLRQKRKSLFISKAVSAAGVMLAAIAVLVVPWLVRNYFEFGVARMSDRGGGVAMLRVLEDGMSTTEYWGSFYVWAPPPTGIVVGALLGFSATDLEAGGRLQRLNRWDSSFAERDKEAQMSGHPERAVSFYRKALASVNKEYFNLKERGVLHPYEAADGVLTTRALGEFAHMPMRHFLVMGPLLWRGAGYLLPFLIVALILAMRRRRYQLLWYLSPTILALGFYLGVTHFLLRYGILFLPVAISACAAEVGATRLGVWVRNYARGLINVAG